MRQFGLVEYHGFRIELSEDSTYYYIKAISKDGSRVYNAKTEKHINDYSVVDKIKYAIDNNGDQLS